MKWVDINEIKPGDEVVIGTNYINEKTTIATRIVTNVHKEIHAISYDNTGLVYFPNGLNQTFLILR